jgi:hypothetical protein
VRAGRADRVVLEGLHRSGERGPVARLEDVPRRGGDDVGHAAADDVAQAAQRIAVGDEDPQVGVGDQQPRTGKVRDERPGELACPLEVVEVQVDHAVGFSWITRRLPALRVAADFLRSPEGARSSAGVPRRRPGMGRHPDRRS